MAMRSKRAATDRVLGVLLLGLALVYGWAAKGLEAGFISDPLGPKTFPLIIAICLGLSSLYLIARPDPGPSWPGAGFWPRLALVLASLTAYAYLLVPLGFVISTTLEMALLSFLFGTRTWKGLAAGLIFSMVVYWLFTKGLGVPLPLGKILAG